MNNYDFLAPRRRRQSLFIVEGNHEKNTLIKLLLKCFPEIDIKEDDIVIYGTNIYMLYDALVEYYGQNWYEIDVDLAYVVSQKKRYTTSMYKSDFNNIVLIFDYEHHDPKFSEDKICILQEYFSNSTDVGKLFVNYPMIESYQHFDGWPNDGFENVSVPVTLQPGSQYKNLVKNTMIANLVELPIKIDEILKEKFHVSNESMRYKCVEDLLLLNNEEGLEQKLEMLLSTILAGPNLKTAQYHMLDVLTKAGYLMKGSTYYDYMRILFIHIIRHNVFKARKITGESYCSDPKEFRTVYDAINFVEILQRENDFSRDETNGIIMVLNTSVFFVPDYNISLVENIC